MKQLDIEPAEEMPSSTLTSTEGITPCHPAPVLPQRLQINSDTTIEQGEIVTETDMPPLTGKDFILIVCEWLDRWLYSRIYFWPHRFPKMSLLFGKLRRVSSQCLCL